MYLLKLKLNRLIVYKSYSSNFVILVVGKRVVKKAAYDTFFVDFKKLSDLFWQPSLTQIRFSPELKRLLKQRLAL